MSPEIHSEADDERKSRIDERVRGVLVMVLGTGALVGIAYGAMTLLTAPDGWAMKAANATVSEALESSPQFASSIEEQQ
jgi:hypothetical protein